MRLHQISAVAAVMLAVAVQARAQQPAQPSPAEQLEQANARMAVLARQRDDAHNRLVIVEAEAVRIAGEAQRAKDRIAELEKLCGDPCKAKAAGKP